jgi:hypothetical protein
MRDKINTPRGETKQPTPAMRWLSIMVRTGHIGVAAVFFGGCVLHVPFPQLVVWHHLTIASGGVLLVLELLHDRRWLLQGKGLLGILHIVPGVLLHLNPGLTVPLLWGVLVSGCIGSHMPRRFRHWSILHGKETWEKKEPH